METEDVTLVIALLLNSEIVELRFAQSLISGMEVKEASAEAEAEARAAAFCECGRIGTDAVGECGRIGTDAVGECGRIGTDAGDGHLRFLE